MTNVTSLFKLEPKQGLMPSYWSQFECEYRLHQEFVVREGLDG